MSEPQHPQRHETDMSAGHDAVPLGAQAAGASAALDSLAAMGAHLAQLREAKGWTIEDVSARLKVSPQKLRALEAGDISSLPGTTFAQGVVRSYAKMLGADPAPFTQAVRREKGIPEPELSMPAAVGTGLPRGKVSVSLGGGQKHRSWLWGVAFVIVAVIALAMWHTGGDSSAWLARLKASASGAAGGANGASASAVEGQTAASAATAVDNGASAAATAASDALAASDTNDASDAAGAAGNATQPAPAPASVPAAQPAPAQPAPAQPAPAVAAPAPKAPAVAASAASAADPAPAPARSASLPQAAQQSAAAAASAADATSDDGSAGESILSVSMTQDSWVNVRDKKGKEIFSGIVHSGDAKEISGEPPFKVTIGNKSGLDSLTMDGQPVDSAKYSAARGNVARFSLP
jgi:cytoskeleton protein RodZ